MDKTFHFQTISYNGLLKAERFRFMEDEKCLNVGSPAELCGFALFISCRTKDTPELLIKCLPLLKSTASTFRLIKNQNLQYRLNSGTFGDNESGKVISIFPQKLDELKFLVHELTDILRLFKGPVIPEAQRLSNVLYIQSAMYNGPDIKLSKPRLTELPVIVPELYRKSVKQNVILNWRYLPVQTLRTSAKGNIYKGIILRKLSFNWCLIKQGNPVAFDDHFDRDMKDRLLWQKEVITKLQPHICTPQVIEYFESNGSSYLIMEYAEGDPLGHYVRDKLNGKEWRKIEVNEKRKILLWYMQAVNLCECLHAEGVIHRDITDSNFIILKDGRLSIIDFELSFSLKDQRPDPPFLLGTFGYASPEQLKYHYPDPGDDVYSLGALLAFVLTGCQPHEFLDTSLSIIHTKLSRLTGTKTLSDLTCKCLQPNRKDRPTIEGLRAGIDIYLQTLKPLDHETFAMAL